jgi:adenine phosphoribosyltransferase
VDYTGQLKSLESKQDVFKCGARILLVDEWVETGAQIKAAASLIEGQFGVIVGIAAINIDINDNTRTILQRYNCQTLMNSN